jgi:hypothetical protein
MASIRGEYVSVSATEFRIINFKNNSENQKPQSHRILPGLLNASAAGLQPLCTAWLIPGFSAILLQ